jgi:hypothetical protein
MDILYQATLHDKQSLSNSYKNKQFKRVTERSFENTAAIVC